MTDVSFFQNNKRLILRLILSFLLFLVAAGLFGFVSTNVHQGDTLTFDQSFLRSINSYSSPFLDSFFLIFTELGGVIAVTITSLALFSYFMYKKQRYNALLLGVGVGGAALVNYIAKITFERARPELWHQLITETTYSFPSGHAAGSSALAICIVALLWRTKWRLPALIIAPIYIILIGVSRMYLGVHYLTDVLAGWILSIAWVTLVTSLVYARRSRRRQKADMQATL
ncbi:phosphatase PAP2 family protein [bacterium]|nr:MAG: phosphatase PAP2 family protein [bacterium]